MVAIFSDEEDDVPLIDEEVVQCTSGELSQVGDNLRDVLRGHGISPRAEQASKDSEDSFANDQSSFWTRN